MLHVEGSGEGGAGMIPLRAAAISACLTRALSAASCGSAPTSFAVAVGVLAPLDEIAALWVDLVFSCDEDMVAAYPVFAVEENVCKDPLAVDIDLLKELDLGHFGPWAVLGRNCQYNCP